MTAAVLTAFPTVPWWRDPRFAWPAVFVGAAAVAAVAAALFSRRGASDPSVPSRHDAGLAFPGRGFVLCPQGEGVSPTTKPLASGDFVVLWLGDPAARFVEATWARVQHIDPTDSNRVLVVVGSPHAPGTLSLRTPDHGFSEGDAIWVAADCIPDALQTLKSAHAAVLCGSALTSFQGGAPPYAAAVPPAPVDELVGRGVEVLLVSRAGDGLAWQAPALARIVEVSQTGQIATIEVVSVQAPGGLSYGPAVAGIKAGTVFDITWDCVLSYPEAA